MDAGLVDSFEQLKGPRQKQVQQENPILSRRPPISIVRYIAVLLKAQK